MTQLDKQILQKATGETRLKPDQQRHCLGTFQERILLTISREDAGKTSYINAFPEAMQAIKKTYSPLSIKISSHLSSSLQMTYMKMSNRLDLNATIVSETGAQSPFGVVVHTDKAANIDNPDLAAQFPQLLEATDQPKKTRVSFFQKLFGKG